MPLPDSIEEDREYLEKEVPALAGKDVDALTRLGHGFRHNVDELDGEVVKIPKRRGSWRRAVLSVLPFLPLKRARTYEESVHEHTLASAYLGSLIPTTIIDATRDGLYVEEQEKLAGVKPIRKKDMQYPRTHDAVFRVIERNGLLITREQRSIAFLGLAGVIPSFFGRPTMTNVERTSKGVQVVDFDLLDLTNRADRSTYFFNRRAVLRYFPKSTDPQKQNERETVERMLPPLRKINRRR